MASEALIDEAKAAEMLRNDTPIRTVAEHFGVSTQAVYLAIRQGRLPKRERHGGPLGDRISRDGTPEPQPCAGSNPNRG